MLPGETVASGAPLVCPDCENRVPGPRILRSGAGWFVGFGGCLCGPVYSRESRYFSTADAARTALLEGLYGR